MKYLLQPRLTVCYAACLLNVACVSTRVITPSNNNAALITYDRGTAILTSTQSNSVIVRLAYASVRSNRDSLPGLEVRFVNIGSQAVDFSTANVSAYSGGKLVHVYTYEEIQKRIQRQADMARFAVALAAGLEAGAASMPQRSYNYGTVNTNAYAMGSGGYAYGHATSNYSGTTTTYDPAASVAAISQIQSNTVNEMQMINQAQAAAMERSNTILRRTTIFPGQQYGGIVFLDPKDFQPDLGLKVVVLVAGEAHVFLFDVTP